MSFDVIEPVYIEAADPISLLLEGAISSFRPPPKIDIAEFVEGQKFLVHPNKGAILADFDEAPYQRKICKVLSEREYEGAIFVAPSRSGKSVLLLPMMHHASQIDPRDMMIIAPTRGAAGTYAKGDFAKYVEANRDFKNDILPGKVTDAQMFKMMRNGMIVSIVWPTATNLAGVDRGIIAIMDYDRIKLDVSGEGSVFNQAYARTKLYGNRKKIFAESSPSHLPEDPEPFEPETMHQAPPFPGIFSLYNMGTRELWFWKCLDNCGSYFEAHSRYLDIPDEGSAHKRGKMTRMVCPVCGKRYSFDGEDGGSSRYHLNKSGVWVPEGMKVDRDGTLVGDGRVSKMASFWLNGVSAQGARWDELVEKRISAEKTFEDTGKDDTLKNVVNSDFGMAYFPPGIIGSSAVDDLMARAQAYPYERKVVPAAARYLITTVDTQKREWVLQTQAFDLEGRMWVIHRKRIWESERTEFRKDGSEIHSNVSPFSMSEDWDVLAEYLSGLSYPVEGLEGVFMRPAMIGVDCGGGAGTRDDDDGVTASATYNAYAFWRKLRDGGTGAHQRIRLLKGEPKKGAPFIETRMQSETSTKDVPVFFIGSTSSKDMFDALLSRTEEGPGFVYLPSWHDNEANARKWFAELISERKVAGRWSQVRKRNEAWDLCVYACALVRAPSLRGDQLMSSKTLPDYAKPIDENPHVMREMAGKMRPHKTEDWRQRLGQLSGMGG